MSGRSSTRCDCTEMPFFTTSPRVRAMLEDCCVDVHFFVPERCFFEKRAHPADDLVNAIAVCNDPVESLPSFLQICRFFAQPVQPRRGIIECRPDRLVDFMGNRSRELPHCCDSI